MSKKIIAITGAGKGIGEATARLFVKNDWFVVLMDINGAAIEALAKELGKPHAVAIPCDVTNADQVNEAMVKLAQITNQQLNVLVNNAGVVEVGPFESHSLENQHKIIEVNLKGVINTTYHALPLLKQNKGSHIINLSSASALFGNPELPVYAATKSAVKSLTEGWSVGFEKYGIKVSDLLPIFVDTDMVRKYYKDYQSLTPDKVKLTAEDIANIIWKAVHKNKLHWFVGTDTKTFAFLSRFLPYSIQRMILKKVIGYK